MILNNYSCNILCKVLIKMKSMWRCEIKEQTPTLTLLYCGRTVRSSQKKCSIKKDVLKNSPISTGSTCVGDPKHRCFPVNIAKILRLFWKTSENSCFLTVLMVHSQSVLGRNECMCGSSHGLYCGHMRSCAIHNSFASYDGNIICACCKAEKTQCQWTQALSSLIT